MRGIAYGTYGNAVGLRFAQDERVASKSLKMEKRDSLHLEVASDTHPHRVLKLSKSGGSKGPGCRSRRQPIELISLP